MTTVTRFGYCGSQVKGELFCLEALYPDGNVELGPFYAFKTSTDPDTMCMNQAMKEPDWEQFKKAMVKEVKDQMENGSFTIVKQSSIPPKEPVMPTVWQMKRKRTKLGHWEGQVGGASLFPDGIKMKHRGSATKPTT